MSFLRNLFCAAALVALPCAMLVAQNPERTDTGSTTLKNPLDQTAGVDLTLPEFLIRNTDDDQTSEQEGYEIWDRDNTPSEGEDDLKELIVSGTADKKEGTLTVEILQGNDKIKRWTDATKTAPMEELTWQVPARQTLTKTIYLEGYECSGAKGDIEIKATFSAPGVTIGQQPYNPVSKSTDVLESTVYEVDLDVDSNNNGTIEGSDAEDQIEDSDDTPSDGDGGDPPPPDPPGAPPADEPVKHDHFGKFIVRHTLIAADNSTSGSGDLTPVKFDVKKPLSNEAKVTFTYEQEGDPANGEPGIRLLKENSRSGTHIESGKEYPISAEGIGGASGTLYLELADKRKPEISGQVSITMKVVEGEVTTEDVVRVFILPVEVVELAPKIRDLVTDEEIDGSEVPDLREGRTNPMVELNPDQNRIAHRELKVRIGEALAGKTVTWTMEPLFIPHYDPNGPNLPPVFRGQWTHSTNHSDRFETSAVYGANGFTRLSQESGRTTVANDGFTAIRVNLPPVGFNRARVWIQIEGTISPIDLIDMEVPAIVVIDPGHGGTANRPGSTWNNATSPSGVREKDMTLEYGRALRDSIETYAAENHLQIRVRMTRDSDINYSGEERANMARDAGADVFHSFHFNAANGAARGSEALIRGVDNVNEAKTWPWDAEFLTGLWLPSSSMMLTALMTGE
ncbi:MAG: N-acetylmuramoyl-L-alanine amidase [Verrucomicrobiota bacterium]